MTEENENQKTEQMPQGDLALKATLHQFRKSLPKRVMLQQMLRFIGNIHGHVCLDVGVENGMVSHHLRKKGGKWTTVAVDDASEASLKAVLEEDVRRLKADGGLPFKKQSYDLIVVVNMLETVSSDEAFVEDCHRILKNDGRLVICTMHKKSWSFINLLRSMLGLVPEFTHAKKHGYTEAELFGILKNGFDVYSVRSYSKFCVQFVDTIVKSLTKKHSADVAGESIRKIYSSAAPFYWLAHQLDMLLFLSKGHCLVAEAKRRGWKDRNAPILTDGRSITEAVLSPIG